MFSVVRTLAIFAVAAGFFPGVATAVLPEQGDSRGEVIRLLGTPDGIAWMGDREIYQYARGRVILSGGVVQAVDMLTNEVFQAQEARAARRAEEAAKLAAQRRKEGEARRLATLADPDFRRLPAADQLRFWRRFAADYPEVSVAHSIFLLTREMEREQGKATPPYRAMRLETWSGPAAIRKTGPVYGISYPTFYPHGCRPRYKAPVRRGPSVAPEPDDSLRARIFRDFEANRRTVYTRIDTAPARRTALGGD